MKKKSRLEIGIIMFYLDVHCPHDVNNPKFTQKLYTYFDTVRPESCISQYWDKEPLLPQYWLIDSALRLIDYHSLSK